MVQWHWIKFNGRESEIELVVKTSEKVVVIWKRLIREGGNKDDSNTSGINN
jgi:hypothetical protein